MNRLFYWIYLKELCCAGDLTGFHALGANQDAFDRASHIDFDRLKIGEEGPKRFTNDLGTGTALTAHHTASLIFNAGGVRFRTNCTSSSHNINLKFCGEPIKGFLRDRAVVY